jgi:hypothetical protein
MHFCAYAYVLSRRGAQKIIDVLKAKGGYWTSADHMICNIHEYMNIYFTNPLIAGCFQDDDPVYCNSQFNDFSRVDKFDSDLWNNVERFTEEEVFAGLAGSGTAKELDIMGALADAAAGGVAPTSSLVPAPAAAAEPSSLAAYPKESRRRFVSICGPPMDMSKMYEYSWFKMLFPEDKYSLEVFSIREPPTDVPIVIVQAPYVNEAAEKLIEWSSYEDIQFYILHLSDEYAADRVDFYYLPGCLGVIRNYLRKDVVESSKVCVIPLGFHWAVPNCNPAVNTPRPPFREFAWSFVGTAWASRKEKLKVLEGIPDCKSKVVFMEEWNSPKMLGREESLGIMLNSWFVACPAGNNAETYRFYEALEAGAVPVIVKEGDCEQFLQLIGRYLPLMVCDNWEHAAQLIFTLMKNVELYEQYRNSLLNAWEHCKIHVKQSILTMFKPKNELETLIDSSRSDKNTIHSYLELYNTLLLPKKNTTKNVLEIGIQRGGSIRMWSDFFTNAHIYGVDVMDSSYVWEGIRKNNITLYTSTDGYDKEFVKTAFSNIRFDFMLDDGPHTLESMIQFIHLYSPLMTQDGILIIEDVQSWDWIDILTKETPEELKKFVKSYDLRKNKNRYDDIVFTIHKSKEVS